jgi:2'-5' RNA ligase
VIRAFIAVELAPATIAAVAAAIDELRAKLPAIRWVSPANFHLTVKFLGDIDANQVVAVGDALAGPLGLFPRCTINAKGLGVFPGPKQPKIFWVGFFGAELARLAATIDRALVPLGFSLEQRAFTPHLTIGRWRQVERSANQLEQELKRWRERDFGTTIVDRVILFQSVLKPTGAIYTQLKTIKLNDQPID